MKSSLFLFVLLSSCLNIWADFLYLISSFDCLIIGVFFDQNKLNQGYEIISAAKEHDGKGKEDRDQEEEVDTEEEYSIDFFIA